MINIKKSTCKYCTKMLKFDINRDIYNFTSSKILEIFDSSSQHSTLYIIVFIF